MKNRIICGVLLILILIRPAWLIYQTRDKFFSPSYTKQYDGFRSAYYSSQYIKKVKPGIIPDETLEAFAAGTFLRGLNPILIVHDQPPLGRYILALSIILFDNVNTIMLP